MSVVTSHRRPLGNPRNGAVEGDELAWMWSLHKRQIEFDRKMEWFAWLKQSINADIWTLIKIKWRLLELLTIGSRGRGRPFNFEIDGISYTSRRYRLK